MQSVDEIKAVRSDNQYKWTKLNCLAIEIEQNTASSFPSHLMSFTNNAAHNRWWNGFKSCTKMTSLKASDGKW